MTNLCRRSYMGLCSGGVCLSDLCRRSYLGLCSGDVCLSDLCRRSYIGFCSGVVCVSDAWRRSYIGFRRRGVSVIDLCPRSYIGVCRGGVCVSDLCGRSYIGVCRGGVCVSDLCRRSYIGVYGGGVGVSDLCRRSYIGVCRGGVGVTDLCRRSCIGPCRGDVCVVDLWRVSVSDLCVAAVILAFDVFRLNYTVSLLDIQILRTVLSLFFLSFVAWSLLSFLCLRDPEARSAYVIATIPTQHREFLQACLRCGTWTGSWCEGCYLRAREQPHRILEYSPLCTECDQAHLCCDFCKCEGVTWSRGSGRCCGRRGPSHWFPRGWQFR